MGSMHWLWESEVARLKYTNDPTSSGKEDNGGPCQDVAAGYLDDCYWTFVIKYLHMENVSVATYLLS